MVIEKDGYKFLVEEGLGDHYGSFKIDYNHGWLRRGFVILPNGKEVASC